MQSTCSCPSTSSPRLIRSRVSVGDLQRAPARCSIRPGHRPKLQVAVCSRADASHGLRDVNVPPGRAAQRAACGLWSMRWPVELPLARDPSCTAQPRVCGSKYYLNPSSWARTVPVLRFASLLRTTSPDNREVLQLTCSSRCSSSVRIRWKMTLTRAVETLAARYRRATAHDTRI